MCRLAFRCARLHGGEEGQLKYSTALCHKVNTNGRSRTQPLQFRVGATHILLLARERFEKSGYRGTAIAQIARHGGIALIDPCLGGWISLLSTCPSFHYLAHGETRTIAIEQIGIAIENWINTAREIGREIPRPTQDWAATEKELDEKVRESLKAGFENAMPELIEALAKEIGGALIVCEAIIDDQRRQNTFGLLRSLNMLIETQAGVDYTGADCSRWMLDAGFKETRVESLCGPDSTVVGIS